MADDNPGDYEVISLSQDELMVRPYPTDADSFRQAAQAEDSALFAGDPPIYREAVRGDQIEWHDQPACSPEETHSAYRVGAGVTALLHRLKIIR